MSGSRRVLSLWLFYLQAPRSRVEYFCDERTLFFSDSKTGAPFTAFIQIGTDRTMWNITLNVFVWKRNIRHCKYLANFHFWVNYPFNSVTSLDGQFHMYFVYFLNTVFVFKYTFPHSVLYLYLNTFVHAVFCIFILNTFWCICAHLCVYRLKQVFIGVSNNREQGQEVLFCFKVFGFQKSIIF